MGNNRFFIFPFTIPTIQFHTAKKEEEVFLFFKESNFFLKKKNNAYRQPANIVCLYISTDDLPPICLPDK